MIAASTSIPFNKQEKRKLNSVWAQTFTVATTKLAEATGGVTVAGRCHQVQRGEDMPGQVVRYTYSYLVLHSIDTQSLKKVMRYWQIRGRDIQPCKRNNSKRARVQHWQTIVNLVENCQLYTLWTLFKLVNLLLHLKCLQHIHHYQGDGYLIGQRHLFFFLFFSCRLTQTIRLLIKV